MSPRLLVHLKMEYNTRVALPRSFRYDGRPSCTAPCSSCTCYDIYFPPPATPAPEEPPHAVVMFMHGGLWWSGSRQEGAALCKALAEQHSIPCATIDYELSGDLGGCCEDTCKQPSYNLQAQQAAAAAVAIQAAVQTRYATAAPIPLVVSGHSAGGHLALLLALRWADYDRAGAPAPFGYVGVEGIYDVAMW